MIFTSVLLLMMRKKNLLCRIQNMKSLSSKTKTVRCRRAVALNLSPLWGLHLSFIGLRVVNPSVTLIPHHPYARPNETVPCNPQSLTTRPDCTTSAAERGCCHKPSQLCSRTDNHPSIHQKDSEDLSLYIWIIYILYNCLHFSGNTKNVYFQNIFRTPPWNS